MHVVHGNQVFPPWLCTCAESTLPVFTSAKNACTFFCFQSDVKFVFRQWKSIYFVRMSIYAYCLQAHLCIHLSSILNMNCHWATEPWFSKLKHASLDQILPTVDRTPCDAVGLNSCQRMHSILWTHWNVSRHLGLYLGFQRAQRVLPSRSVSWGQMASMRCEFFCKIQIYRHVLSILPIIVQTSTCVSIDCWMGPGLILDFADEIARIMSRFISNNNFQVLCVTSVSHLIIYILKPHICILSAAKAAFSFELCSASSRLKRNPVGPRLSISHCSLGSSFCPFGSVASQ